MTDYSSFIKPNGKITVVRVNQDNRVTNYGECGLDHIEDHLTNVECSIALLPEEAAKWDGTPYWLVTDGVLSKTIAPTPSIERIRSQALAKMDVDAERTRLLFITPGYGQSLTYEGKRREAFSFLEAYPDEPSAANASDEDWPFLAAEIDISGDTLFEVATLIYDTAQAWTIAACLIEKMRRGTKKAVVEAATVEEINSLMNEVIWPAPG